MAITKFTKQPNEVLDFDFDFVDWLASKTGLSAVSHEVTHDSGITVFDVRNGAVVKCIVSGGTNGATYKITVRLTTDGTPALVKELEALITIKEI